MTDDDISRLHNFHIALGTGLLLLWLSGAILIGIKTGFDLAQFSPKLIAKIVVVTILTLNAVVIGRIAMPFYEKNRDMRLGDFDIHVRSRLAVCGAISTSSWLSAFCLGAIPALKTASALSLINLLGLFYVGNIVVSIILVLMLQKRAIDKSGDTDESGPKLLTFETSRSTMAMTNVHEAA